MAFVPWGPDPSLIQARSPAENRVRSEGLTKLIGVVCGAFPPRDRPAPLHHQEEEPATESASVLAPAGSDLLQVKNFYTPTPLRTKYWVRLEPYRSYSSALRISFVLPLSNI